MCCWCLERECFDQTGGTLFRDLCVRREDCLDRGHGNKDETFVCKKHAARGEFLVCEDIQREREGVEPSCGEQAAYSAF